MTLPVVFTAGTGAYNIQRSLRFRSSASAYLNRTPASASNRKTFTWSGWLKSAVSSSDLGIISSYSDNNNRSDLRFGNGNSSISFYNIVAGSITTNLTTTQVFRDPSAWYHIVIAVDTTQATSSNRVKLYVNGTQVTAFSTATYPAQNNDFFFNSNVAQYIGATGYSPVSNYLDGYLAEVNFIDGQALTPSSFGQTNSATGVWQPIKYSGTYGTNGFYLNFSDNSNNTATTIGKDYSGNGNNWTPNNISVTSGATYDSMTDVPTLTNATTANYCVMNPLRNINTTITSANLNVASPSSTCGVAGTFAVNTGKWYWEVNCISNGTNTTQGVPHIGIIASDESSLNGSATNMYLYRSNGDLYTGAGYGQTGLATYTNGDVISVAYDAGANSFQFYKNNTAVGTPISTTTNKLYQPYWLVSYVSVNSSAAYNFGQRPFAYTPPSGFVALNTFNLPTPTIGATSSSLANKYFDATLYTGTGASLSVTNANSFQPDMVWIKSRSAATDNKLTDAVRGTTKGLISNTTGAETTDTNGLTAFNSNGFTVGTDTVYNNNTATYVAWQWKANGSGSSNTSGSITSTVSANTTAGFSIVTWTGNGASSATIGHGLGVAPSMIIVKNRSATWGWFVYNKFLTNPNTGRLQLNLTNGEIAGGTPGPWNNTAPTSTVFSLGDSTFPEVNGSGNSIVAYCFAEVAGYSALGKYTGNGSSDGPFIYTGFRPKYVLIKASTRIDDWKLIDTARDPYNLSTQKLYPNLSAAENGSSGETSSTNTMDIVSNGFKLRTSNSATNNNGDTYIYMAFAENPFKYSLAR